MGGHDCLPANASEMSERELEMFAEGFRRAVCLYVDRSCLTRDEADRKLAFEMARALRHRKEHDGAE